MSELQQKKADENLYKAFRNVESNNLIYFELLRKINFLITPDFTQSIGGIGYNPKTDKIYMLLNEQAMAEAHSDDVTGLLEHEVGHLSYDHIFQIHQEKSKDAHISNMAQDYIINESGHYLAKRLSQIKDLKNNSILAGGCFFEDLKKMIPELKDITGHDITSQELYQILLKNKDKFPNGQGGGNGKGCGNGQGFDEHGVFEVSEDENGNLTINGKKLTEEQLNKLSENAKKAMREGLEKLKRENRLSKAIGQLGGEIAFYVSEMIRTRTDKNAIIDFATTVVGDEKKTFMKLNKRYPYLARARRKKTRSKIILGVDTSGSMGGDTFFKMILDQAQKLSSICESLHIVVGDTKLCWEAEIENVSNFKPEDIQFNGGGGTDLQFIWDRAEELGADGVVIHTDGHIGHFDNKDISSIFYLYGEDHAGKIEGFQNIKVYPE